MQLKLRRSQATTGLLSRSALFALDARADLTNEERESVKKYNLGKEVVYASEAAKMNAAAAQVPGLGIMKMVATAAISRMTLTITVDSLMRGQRIEGKDLLEVIAAEEALMQACETMKGYLAT